MSTLYLLILPFFIGGSGAFSPSQFLTFHGHGAKRLPPMSHRYVHPARNGNGNGSTCPHHLLKAHHQPTETEASNEVEDDKMKKKKRIIENAKKISFLEQCKSALDLNNDGKIDAEDLKVLATKLETILDVNGDGKVDANDAKTVLSILMLSGALLVSPPAAHAKGGGGGGGRSGGSSSSRSSSRSSSSRSSSSRSSSSTHYDDYYDDDLSPRYLRRSHPFIRESTYPNACSNFPEEGEVIDMFRDGSWNPAIVRNADKDKCRFVATIDGQTPEVFSTNKNYVDISVGISMATLVFLLLFGDTKRGDTLNVPDIPDKRTKFMMDFTMAPDPCHGGSTSSSSIPPPSGTYTGNAVEWDHGRKIDQEVKTNFIFHENGKIDGSGYDSIDGVYSIDGNWKEWQGGYLLYWKETYEGFSVEVQGRMEGIHGTMCVRGNFRSSLGIKGKCQIQSSNEGPSRRGFFQ